MFDQLPSTPGKTGAPPPNLPTEPEDMFADVDRVPIAAARPTPSPAAPSSTLAAGVISEAMEPERPSRRFKFLPWLIGLVALLVLGGGGVIAWVLSVRQPPTAFVGDKAMQPDTLPSPGNQSQPPAQQNVNLNEPSVVIPPANLNQPPPVAADSDRDGLTDNEEASLGTDPQRPDTDSDGLTDAEEVNIYQTNPLNADSDGDSYPDGTEVRQGYNPNGPGRLFQIQP